jgi:hypothetical protein
MNSLQVIQKAEGERLKAEGLKYKSYLSVFLCIMRLRAEGCRKFNLLPKDYPPLIRK